METPKEYKNLNAFLAQWDKPPTKEDIRRKVKEAMTEAIKTTPWEGSEETKITLGFIKQFVDLDHEKRIKLLSELTDLASTMKALDHLAQSP